MDKKDLYLVFMDLVKAYIEFLEKIL